MSKEKFEVPQADDLVGVPSDRGEIREKIISEFENLFGGIGGQKIEGFEIEKSERDIELIDLANKAISEYLAKYKKDKSVNVPLSNVHLVEEGGTEKFTLGRFGGGAHSTLYGDMIVDRMQSDLDFSLRLFHELFHARSYNAVQLTTAKEPGHRQLKEYRSGFKVTSRDGTKTYFSNVEEAIIGYMTKKFYNDFLVKEKSFSSEIEVLKRAGKEPNFSRSPEQEQGKKLVEKIYELNQTEFESNEEIIELFVEAQITGNLLKVGRLIEKTFGKGSFRKLGEGEALERE
ncbi:MAG: hypothetical protein AAB787_02600 [Patescibacteria group bacterium]